MFETEMSCYLKVKAITSIGRSRVIDIIRKISILQKTIAVGSYSVLEIT